MPAGWGFLLIMGSFEQDGETGGMATWIASIERADAIALMREMADKLERGDPEA